MKTRLLVPLALALAGCYHARVLDAQAVDREVAAEERAALAIPREASAAQAHPLGEDEAVALALRSNPGLRAARRQRGVAEGEVVTAGALANPTLEVELLHLQEYGARNAFAIELGWEPPMPAVYSARRAAARAQRDAVIHEIAEAEWRVAVSVRETHARLLAIAEQRDLVEQALAARRQITQLVEKRLAGGASTRLDLGLAQLAVTGIERERDDLAAEEVSAREALGGLLGVTAQAGAAGQIPEQTAPPRPVDALVDSALSTRPALQAEAKRFAQREQEVRLEYGRVWPWFRFTAAPRYRADASDEHPSDFVLGLELTLPLFNQNQGPIASAEARRDQEREQFRGRVVDLRRDLRAAHDQVELYQGTLRRYRDTVLPGLDAQARMLNLVAGAGQLDVVAVLSAQEAILRTRREYVSYRLVHYQAWLALERLVGRRF